MNFVELSQLAMWEDWQDIVKRSLPNFCASPIYVQQRSQTQEDFEMAAEYVAHRAPIDLLGKTRDAKFGGLVRATRACGEVTRMWLDSNVELDFLRRHRCLEINTSILEIGAGYGRLAVAGSPFVGVYHCVDPVPISTELCRNYTAEFGAGNIVTWALDNFVSSFSDKPDLAINIHSWNECSLGQISRWLGVLKSLSVPLLFTVSNGCLLGGRPPYSSWGGKGESFRPLLEAQYELVAEESIGLSLHPHALWKLK